MPKGMEVFDAGEHIGYDGSAEGDSTGLSKKAGKQRNTGTQKYKGHANGPKKAPDRTKRDPYYLYQNRHEKAQLGLDDLTDDEDFLTVDENLKNVRASRGKRK